MNFSVNIIRKLSLLSLAIPVVFYILVIAFFILNNKAYEELDVLNLFQFNINGIGYRLIPLVEYGLIGFMLMFFWILVWRIMPSIRVSAVIFAVCGILMIWLCSSSDRKFVTNYGFFISVMFVVFTSVGLLLMIVKIKHKISKLVLCFPLLFIVYEILDRFIMLNNGFDINKSIIICFAWYFYMPHLFHKECVDYKTLNQPL